MPPTGTSTPSIGFIDAMPPPAMFSCNSIRSALPLDTAISTRRGVPVNAVGLDVVVKFRLQRPASVRRQYPSVMPDLDKLIRSTGDALKTAGVYTDDSRVVGITAVKVYADTPGADIIVREAVFP